MNQLAILSNLIELVFRESLSSDNKDNNSNHMIKDAISNIETQSSKYSLRGGDSEITNNIKGLISQYISDDSDEPINRSVLINNIKSIIIERSELESILIEPLMQDVKTEDVPGLLGSLRSQISKYITSLKIEKTLKKHIYNMQNNMDTKSDTKKTLAEIINSFELISDKAQVIDPAVGAEVDFTNSDEIEKQVNEAKDATVNDGKYKMGWKAYNRMTSGGHGEGEFIVINALAHNFKSGMMASLFCQTAQFNKPKLRDPKKKPLLLFISLEDDLPIVFKFMYKYLYYNEFNKLPDFSTVSSKEITDYIIAKLGANGWHIKMIRVNPTDWTYKHMFDKTAAYEAEGYEIKNIYCDYLALIPTIGCRSDGPAGTDLRYLFRKTRNHYAAKKITFVTPHQLSTDAKMKLRDDIPDALFVKEIASLSYFSGSKQLDQEMDLEIYCHVCRIKGKYYLSVGRGKHRGNDILDHKHKFFLIPFPDKAPIPTDEDKDFELTYDDTKSDGDGFDDVGGLDIPMAAA